MMTIVPPAKTNDPTTAPPPLTPPAAAWPRPLLAQTCKEFRQNLPFAALALCLEVLTFGYIYFNSGSGVSFENVLLSGTVRTAIPFVCAVAAIVLGLLQPYHDRNFDLWAFLTHRPVPRSLLFVGRAIAGLLLYALITGVPLAILFLYALSPYGRGIFLWQYTLPPIADFFAGIPFYFAALLTVDRNARVYGSRAFPLVAPILAVIITQLSPWFLLAIAGSLLVAALIALAAEGAALSHGYTLRAPLRTRIALTATLILAFTLILFPMQYRDRQVAGQFHYEGRNGWFAKVPVQRSYTVTTRTLLADGQIAAIKQTFSRTAWSRVEFPLQEAHYFDLHGTPLPNAKPADTLPAEQIRQFYATLLPEAVPRRELPTYREIGLLDSSFEMSPPKAPEGTVWYWLRKANLFLLYNYPRQLSGSLTGPRHFLGSLGSNGFVPAGARVLPFPDAHINRFPFIFTPTALYRLSAPPALHTLFQSAPGERLIDIGHLSKSNNATDAQAQILLVTTTEVVNLTGEGKILNRIPIDHDLHKYLLDGTYLPDTHRWCLRYFTWTVWNKPTPNTWEIYDDAGKRLFSVSFPSRSESSPLDYTQVPVTIPVNYHHADANAGTLLALDNPLLALAIDYLWHPLRKRYTFEDRNCLTLAQQLRYPTALLPFALVLLASALLAYLLSVLYRLPRRWRWPLLSLLCGPTTLLAFVALHTWPKRARCPNCKHLRPLVAPTCPYCHTPWPAPPTTPTDIFTPTPEPKR